MKFEDMINTIQLGDCYYSDMPAERIKPLIDILKVNDYEIMD